MKRALVTGAGSGIGAAIAARLADDGWEVIATRLAGQPAPPGAITALVDLDLTDVPSLAEVARHPLLSDGLDLLVHSAGVSLPAPVEYATADAVLLQFRVNALAPIELTRLLLPSLERRTGRVLAIGAGQGRVALPFGGAYAASKAALAALCDALHLELRPFGIGVGVLELGAVRTPILDESQAAAERLLAAMPEEGIRRYAAGIRATLATATRAFETALPPDRVAEIVAAIAAAPRVRPRYLLGRAAWVLAALALLPARWRAALLTRSRGPSGQRRA